MTEKNIGGRGNQSFERNEAIYAARESGITFPKMQEMFGLSRQRLVQILNAEKARALAALEGKE